MNTKDSSFKRKGAPSTFLSPEAYQQDNGLMSVMNEGRKEGRGGGRGGGVISYIRKLRKDSCKNRVVIPQYSGTCWFNAILMALFYSDGTRQVLLKSLPKWGTSHVKNVIREILMNYHTHKEHEYMKFFDVLRPENILTMLNKENSTTFFFNPEKKEGFFSFLYMPKLLKYLHLDSFIVLDLLPSQRQQEYRLAYGLSNIVRYDMQSNRFKWDFSRTKVITVVNQLSEAPDLLILESQRVIDKNKDITPSYFFTDQYIKLAETITYNNHKYIADSMLLVNYNQDVCKLGHEIAGVTCSGKRYMYNGWLSRSMDMGITRKILRKVPCALMHYDWLQRSNKFCIDSNKCMLVNKNDKSGRTAIDLCFSFDDGPRTYIYVREDLLQNQNKQNKQNKQNNQVKTKQDTPKEDTPKEKETVMTRKEKEVTRTEKEKKDVLKAEREKTCPETQIINPVTNRCVSKSGAIGRKILGENNPPERKRKPKTENIKTCPDEKIMNPETGRCVSRSGAIGRKLLSR